MAPGPQQAGLAGVLDTAGVHNSGHRAAASERQAGVCMWLRQAEPGSVCTWPRRAISTGERVLGTWRGAYHARTQTPHAKFAVPRAAGAAKCDPNFWQRAWRCAEGWGAGAAGAFGATCRRHDPCFRAGQRRRAWPKKRRRGQHLRGPTGSPYSAPLGTRTTSRKNQMRPTLSPTVESLRDAAAIASGGSGYANTASESKRWCVCV